MSNHNSTRSDTPEAIESLTEYDVVILSDSNLNEFIDYIGVENIPEHVTVLTEDTHTRNTVEFNLVTIHENTYGVATQLHHPISSDDSVLDIRTTDSSFADILIGL